MGSSKSVLIGGTLFGGGAPVRVESMLKTRLEDASGCIEEVQALAKEGCELVRIAFPAAELGKDLSQVVRESPIPIMGDIHFNHKLAIAALEAGVASVRINPGNMGSQAGLLEVLAAAKDHNAVIRIGANGGSVSRSQMESANGDSAMALVLAVEEQLAVLLDHGFDNLLLSAKSSSVPQTIRANAILSQKYPFPLHIGITEAGPGVLGAVKSAAGIGILLAQGIGDTLRVSLSSPSVEEVRVGYGILRSLELRKRGINLISCPGCGRRRVDVQQLVEQILPLLPPLPDGFTVAIMGCEVNGPQEAAGADLGIAGTAGGVVLFHKGKPIATTTADQLEAVLKQSLAELLR